MEGRLYTLPVIIRTVERPDLSGMDSRSIVGSDSTAGHRRDIRPVEVEMGTKETDHCRCYCCRGL